MRGIFSLRKKEPGALLPDVTGTDVPAILTDSVISIRSLLDYVNRYFPDVLPESVLRYYNHDRRPEGKLGESALYQRRDDTRTDRDVLSDAADGDAANVRETVTGAGCSAIWTDRPTGEKTFLRRRQKKALPIMAACSIPIVRARRTWTGLPRECIRFIAGKISAV